MNYVQTVGSRGAQTVNPIKIILVFIKWKFLDGLIRSVKKVGRGGVEGRRKWEEGKGW